jgi:hypothetical protein
MNGVAALRTLRVALWKCRPVESVENSQNEFPPPSHRAWKSGQGQPDSHISTAPAAGIFMRKETRKDEEKSQFQLTESGHFKHDKNASVAALRKRPASPRNQ